jgi:putative copper export protein
VIYRLLIVAHLLGAAVWVGGHIVLVRGILPRALRQESVDPIRDFEGSYGRLGLSALALQLVTGVWLATYRVPSWPSLFTSAPAHLIVAKLSLLLVTVALAGHAYHRILPGLSAAGLRRFALHAWITTIVGILMLVAGAGIRTGGLL